MVEARNIFRGIKIILILVLLFTGNMLEKYQMTCQRDLQFVPPAKVESIL